MYFRKFWETLGHGLLTYCCFFTVATYMDFLYGRPLKIDLQAALVYIIIFFIFNFAKNTNNPKKGQYDYQNGKLVFKKDDEDQNQA